MEEEEEEEKKRWPPWLRPLLATRFFVQCKLHAAAHKCECNMYCLDCAAGALCSLCIARHHRDHGVIQIRRSSYHDVIRVSEIQRVLDASGVQTYIINSARVVFLNERPQQRGGRGVATNVCQVCDRALLDCFRFCSLGCKVAGTSEEGRSNGRKRSIASITDLEGSYHTQSCTFRPSTPSPTATSSKNIRKRRKGIPHRSPFGGLLEYISAGIYT